MLWNGRSLIPPFRTLCVVTLAASALICVPEVLAQVVIKDTVVISPPQSRVVLPIGKSPPVGSMTPLTDVVVAPTSGVLSITPVDAYKAWTPLPGGSYFRVNAGSQPTISLGVSHYLPCSGNYLVELDTCNSTYTNVTFYYNDWCGGVDTFRTTVLKGDTLSFSFQGELNNPTRQIDHSGNWWGVLMDTYSCNIPLEQASLEFVLEPDTVLRIVDHSPYEIWPYLPPQVSNGDSRGSDQTGYNPTRQFQITVYDLEGQPVSGTNLRVKSEFIPLTGGHEHNDPVLPTNSSGLFYKSGSGSNPKTLTTDSSGTAVVDSFRASQIAGKFLITASLVSDSTKKDTVNITVRRPDLSDFATIQTNFWGLTGNTGLTTYSGCPNTPIRHSSNHWGTQAMADALQVVLIRFLQWGGTQDGGGRFLKLDLNDMSLEKGGVFDICSTWDLDRGHSFHRIGASVDIDNRRRDFETGQILPGGLKIHPDSSRFNRWGEQLEEYMNDHGGFRYPEGPIHFGFGGN